MHLLSSTDVGLKALLFMAACPRRYVQQPEISDLFRINDYALKRPFRALVDGGIISLKMGRWGGYSLKRAPKTVTLEEVVKLLERDFHLIPAMKPNEGGFPLCPNSTYFFALDRAVKAFFYELSNFTIAELAGDPYTLKLLGIPDMRGEAP